MDPHHRHTRTTSDWQISKHWRFFKERQGKTGWRAGIGIEGDWKRKCEVEEVFVWVGRVEKWRLTGLLYCMCAEEDKAVRHLVRTESFFLLKVEQTFKTTCTGLYSRLTVSAGQWEIVEQKKDIRMTTIHLCPQKPTRLESFYLLLN